MIGLDASAGGGALTVRVVTPSGLDPSAADPVTALFASNGVPVSRTAISALTFTLAAGSLMGVPANTPFSLWLAWFDVSGTAMLGLINCRNGSAVSSISGDRASAVAESGGAADDAQKFYAASSITDKPVSIIGRLEWDAGLTTPGQWVAPSRKTPYFPGMKLPGDIVQIVSAQTTTQINNSGMTYVAAGPSVSLTPQSAANLVALSTDGPLGMVASAGGHRSSMRINRGGAQVGRAAQYYSPAAGTIVMPASAHGIDAPGTRSACTWGVQIASGNGDLVTWGNGGFDGCSGATLTAAEIVA